MIQIHALFIPPLRHSIRPVTIILSDKPITHNTGKSIGANIPTKKRGLDLWGWRDHKVTFNAVLNVSVELHML